MTARSRKPRPRTPHEKRVIKKKQEIRKAVREAAFLSRTGRAIGLTQRQRAKGYAVVFSSKVPSWHYGWADDEKGQVFVEYYQRGKWHRICVNLASHKFLRRFRNLIWTPEIELSPLEQLAKCAE